MGSHHALVLAELSQLHRALSADLQTMQIEIREVEIAQRIIKEFVGNDVGEVCSASSPEHSPGAEPSPATGGIDPKPDASTYSSSGFHVFTEEEGGGGAAPPPTHSTDEVFAQSGGHAASAPASVNRGEGDAPSPNEIPPASSDDPEGDLAGDPSPVDAGNAGGSDEGVIGSGEGTASPRLRPFEKRIKRLHDERPHLTAMEAAVALGLAVNSVYNTSSRLKIKWAKVPRSEERDDEIRDLFRDRPELCLVEAAAELRLSETFMRRASARLGIRWSATRSEPHKLPPEDTRTAEERLEELEAPQPIRYRLKNYTGRYLAKDARSTTIDPEKAWVGDQNEIDDVKKGSHQIRQMYLERVRG